MTVSDDELIARLETRAVSYRQGGPSSEHTAMLLDEAADRIRSLSESKREMEKALEPFARMPILDAVPDAPNSTWASVPFSWLRRARAVIAKEAGHAE